MLSTDEIIIIINYRITYIKKVDLEMHNIYISLCRLSKIFSL